MSVSSYVFFRMNASLFEMAGIEGTIISYVLASGNDVSGC